MDVKYAVNQWMTPHNTLEQDVEQMAATGATGIGLWEAKLGDPSEDGAVRELLDAHGLRVTYGSPLVWPLLAGPLDDPAAPQEVPARVDAICRSVERFAALGAMGVIVGGGRSGDGSKPAGPVEAIVEGTAQIADVAREHGLRVGFELIGARRGSPLHRVDDLVAIIEELGRDNVGVLFDVIHCAADPSGLPEVLDSLRRNIDHIDYVQVNDVRDPERSWCDRVLPGDGHGLALPVLTTLLEAGYDGWFELEVFSDDGTFGNTFPDSLWALPHAELLARGRAAFDRVYDEARAAAGAAS